MPLKMYSGGNPTSWQAKQRAYRGPAGLPTAYGAQWMNYAQNLAGQSSDRSSWRRGSRRDGGGSRGGMSKSSGNSMGLNGGGQYSNVSEPEEIVVPDNPYEKEVAEMARNRQNPYAAENKRLVAATDKMVGTNYSEELMKIANYTADRNEANFAAKLGGLGMGELGLATDVQADQLDARNRGVTGAKVAGEQLMQEGLRTASNVYSAMGAEDRAFMDQKVNMLLSASNMNTERESMRMGANITNIANKTNYERTTGNTMGGGGTFRGGRAGFGSRRG